MAERYHTRIREGRSAANDFIYEHSVAKRNPRTTLPQTFADPHSKRRKLRVLASYGINDTYTVETAKQWFEKFIQDMGEGTFWLIWDDLIDPERGWIVQVIW